MFKSIGPLKASKVIRDKATGLSYGYGFVEYISPEHSQRAVDTLDGLNLQSKRIKVAHARVSQDVRPSNLYVSGLPHQLGDAELTALFVPFGAIVRTRVLSDPSTHLSRGVGFVQFSSHDEAQQAINALNEKTPDGLSGPIGVKFAEDNREKAKKSKQIMALNTAGQMLGNTSMMGARTPFGPNAGGMGQMGGLGMMNQGGGDQFGGMSRGMNPSFGAPSNQFGTTSNQFGTPQNQFGAQQNQFGGAQNQFGGAQNQFGGAQNQFGAAQNQFGSPSNQFGAPANQLNQFGMDYQADAGGGPMRNGSQVRQRFDPMSFPGGPAMGGGMNGGGAGAGSQNGGNGPSTGYPLFVYNIGTDTDERALWQLFYPFGALQKVAVVRDNEKKVGKGYGFVTMVNLLEAQNAIQSLNGMLYKDKQLQVRNSSMFTVQPVFQQSCWHIPNLGNNLNCNFKILTKMKK